MPNNVYDILEERGFIAQVTYPEELRELLEKESIRFYTGYDPTADSLHVGHLLQLIAMSHLQKAGHKPIILVGGGTGMIGDPSGRTDLRKMMTPETIQHNVDCFKVQMSRFLEFGEDKAIIVDNADWILDYNYIDFIREYGVHFSVNRMLTAECYKNRMEEGLTFLEFNYMLLQATDFLHLHEKHDCRLEIGGDDQWSNILAGTDLIRRKGMGPVYGMTMQLLTKADGEKMGKTSSGALWLDEEKCSVYDFYQYFRNVDDRDVIKFMKLLTFMPMEEIAEYEKLEGQEINEAKVRLAMEITSLVHGKDKAEKAAKQASEIFSDAGRAKDMPGVDISKDELGKSLLDVLTAAEIIPSKSEGRRLIKQGGLTINDEKVEDFDRLLEESDIVDGSAIIRRGKKKFFALRLND